MQSLKQLCVPRQSVFDTQRRDTVLDISDLVADRVDPLAFFEENFVTEGMRTLLDQSFLRLEGRSQQGVFRLKQAMGGGKTHNLLTLGLLAKYPQYRQQVMGAFHPVDETLGQVQVVAFSGRESDAQLGIWGAIAAQLGKEDHFAANYSPLKAPGQTAWENLFAGRRVLILLDELAPYLENARSISIGDSTLAKVTGTALENLMIAIGKESCANVALVITELKGSHEEGTQQLTGIFRDLEAEIGRIALPIEPVRMGSDELYHILRKRLFESLPPAARVTEVAQAYASAVRDARQMDITNESPEQFAQRVEAAYPFHPAIRDLYARFRENPGFQQTRGLIRLMRIIVSRMWSQGDAEKSYLISAHDLDFNDRETRTEIGQINATLDNAIAHDIASEGNAVAELMDANLGGTDARDTCRLLLMASLANVPNAVRGLTIPELVAYLAEPGRDLARLRTDVLEKLATAAWYLHSDRDGKLFFKNVQNLNAKLESLAGAYLREQAVKELRARLEALFHPEKGWCYQKVLALPALDEIELEQDRVCLVIVEPYPGAGLRPELLAYFENAAWKNRLAFLTGSRDTYEDLIATGKRLKAIQQILTDLQIDRVADNDPQMVQARDLADRIQSNFLSAARETFTTLWYPIEENNSPGLFRADFSMRFEGNRYNGEQQIIALLTEKRKFEEDISGEMFRKKCERRLFTIQSMPWAEVKRRAAMQPIWQWHHPAALDNLKADCLAKDIWREQGGYVDKGPFPQPRTTATVQEISRNPDTGEATLKVTPLHGDTIFYDVGADATPASARLEGSILKTSDLCVSFLVIDSTHQHETGEPVQWKNRLTIKYRVYDSGRDRKMQLKVAPDAVIHYSTDGSDPKVAGAVYDEDFIIPKNAPLVLAYAERDGVVSEVERIVIHWDQDAEFQIEPRKPAVWKKSFQFNSTKDTYEFLVNARSFRAAISGIRITIAGEDGNQEWIELSMHRDKKLSPDLIEKTLETLREVQGSGQVQLTAESLHFESGQDLMDWAETAKTTLRPQEVRQ